jgi:hypothetical protein
MVKRDGRDHSISFEAFATSTGHEMLSCSQPCQDGMQFQHFRHYHCIDHQGFVHWLRSLNCKRPTVRREDIIKINFMKLNFEID